MLGLEGFYHLPKLKKPDVILIIITTFDILHCYGIFNVPWFE